MGLFDNIQNAVSGAANAFGGGNGGGQLQRKTVVFQEMPETLEQMMALPEAKMKDPFDVAALTVAALCVWPSNKEESIRMLNFLKGPQPLSPMQISFIADRFRDADYVPRSYLKGATPQNNYMPQRPYSVEIYELAHSRDNFSQGYITLNLNSGGADSPRQIQLRTKPSTGDWFLWEQFILVGIRVPDQANPWA
ncbi:MAG: hypothetical protein J5636_11615 [Clostridiales bacterium]|nr:hypothetical protein [Clostridiales bacterium]